jgi:hypothetical protein
VCADALQVRNQVLRGIGMARAMRKAAPGATLIHENNAMPAEIEKPVLRRIAATARTAMQKQNRGSVRRSCRLDPNLVAVTDPKMESIRLFQSGHPRVICVSDASNPLIGSALFPKSLKRKEDFPACRMPLVTKSILADPVLFNQGRPP